IRLRGRVARDEAVPAELARDCIDRSGDALVAARKEADEGDVEHARVELLRPVVLRERAAFGVVALVADLGVDLVANLSPAVERRVELELLRKANGAVEDDPRHHLRVREVSPRAARLPDP